MALVSAAILVATTGRVPQSLDSDPAWGLKAAVQYVAGESPTPNTLVQPQTSDLTQDSGRWVTWWAPGVPFLAAPLMAQGLSPGRSVRVLAVLFLVAGAAGWAYWVSLFRLPAVPAVLLGASLPWMRYASSTLFVFIAEIFVFGALPWLILGARWIGMRWRSGQSAGWLWAATFGVLLGSAYFLKYSALLPAAGALLFLAFEARRSRSAISRRAWTELAIVSAGFAISVGTVALTSRALGGTANLVTEAFDPGFNPWALIHASASPILKAGDFDAVFRQLFMRPDRPLVEDGRVVLLVALPAFFTVVWLFIRDVHRDNLWTLTACVAGGSIVLLAAVEFMANAVSYEARHGATAGIVMLPLLIRSGLDNWARVGVGVRMWLAGCLCSFTIIPFLYGYASVAVKVTTDKPYVVGSGGIRNTLLAPSSVPACREELMRDFDQERDIWVLPEPLSALDLPGRSVIVHVEYTRLNALATAHNATSPVRVHMLLPPHVADAERGQLLRSSFAAEAEWSRETLVSCSYQRWIANVMPDGI